ncbi:MAG TPA: CHRD domain-containing protein [Acidimicrobiales bacterium]|nr:CHRD domain-containing protein [Acidimicrobiales bacterium]
MRRTTKRVAGLSAVVLAGAAFGPLDAAFAGHENAVLTTELNGPNEVPATGETRGNVGDPDGRGEAYVFGIDGDEKTLCYVLTVDDIATATAAHIHEGPPGKNGPVVVNLAAPADGNAADCLTEGEQDKFVAGENGELLTTVAEILDRPEDYYVNVHNAEYPGGAIRGQLAAER